MKLRIPPFRFAGFVVLLIVGAGLLVVLVQQDLFAPRREVDEVWQTYLGEARGNAGDVLEVATLKNEEVVERRDRRYTWWGLYLGENTTRIRVPVTFRYHLLLSDDWHLEIKDGLCRVTAPRLRPSNPPAIHTDGLERYVERGWFRFDQQQQLDALERNLTDLLAARADAAGHINQVRDTARQSVAAFVQQWLLEQADVVGAEDVTAIQVIFADEDPGAMTPLLQLPESR